MFETTTQSERENDFHQSEQGEERSEPQSCLKMPNSPRKASASAERKKKRLLFESRQGREDAQKWVVAAHPAEIVAFMELVGEMYSHPRKPWQTLDEQFPNLHDELKAWGRDYSHAFIACVRTQWQVVKMPWEHALYSEGIKDGRRWVHEFARRDQVECLRSKMTSDPLEVLPNPGSCRDFEFASPAHKLVASILGEDYPRFAPANEDEYGDIITNCDEFKQFWQPFVNEPMDQVAEELTKICSITNKLLSAKYITGFVDGALGISDGLKAKHFPG